MQGKVTANRVILGGAGSPFRDLDTSGDGVLSPIDFLLVINWLNRASVAGSGESTSTTSDFRNVLLTGNSTDTFEDWLDAIADGATANNDGARIPEQTLSPAISIAVSGNDTLDRELFSDWWIADWENSKV